MSAAPSHAPKPLQGGDLFLGTVALSLATFMNVLDSSIANVSLPAIAGNLGVSPTQGTWVITSFGVSNAISVPLTGWLTQRFGAVRLFTASVLLFVLASWMCGLASSLEMLIAFRVLQGLVAGQMIPLSQTLLLSSYPPAKAGMALAMWAMTTLVAPVTGPLLGGWITDNMSWPWIFYINIPVGLGAALVTWRIYANRETPTKKLPIDTVGLSLLVLWVGALQIMLDKGKELDWFESSQIVILGLVALIGFAVFLVWELTQEHPVVDLRLFASRNFLFGVIALSVAYGLFFGNVVLLPMWLQQYMGYTASVAGMAVAPVGLLAILLSPIVGKNVTRMDPRWLATVAFLGFALVMWMRSHFNTLVDFNTILVPTILQGGAIAFFFIPLSAITLNGLTPDRIPSASGLSNFVRITAGAMGTSMVATAWDDRATMHHVHLAEKVSRTDPGAMDGINALMNTGMSFEQAAAQISRLIDQQAFTRAADDVYLISSVLFLCLIPIVWLAKPKKSAAAVDAGGAH
ncbi:MAG: DHA2 family efflux MFS transporter permease subunit [Aquabacterium sp.]|nr:DHA2 family efflux MFS transporter permease subunit [Aquabacterium sp.]